MRSVVLYHPAQNFNPVRLPFHDATPPTVLSFERSQALTHSLPTDRPVSADADLAISSSEATSPNPVEISSAELSDTDRPTVDALARTYDRYHGTGFYARRYPTPNTRCLSWLLQLSAKVGPDVLDFGCGDGRYAAPLLEQAPTRVVGYDISDVALAELTQRCRPHITMGRLRTVGGDLDNLMRTVDEERFDLIILMFGVLGHIPGRTNRVATLSRLRSLLRPGGRVVVTVPNARRRFQAEQRLCQPQVASGRLEPGDILYSRNAGGQALDLYYHLYQPGEVERELVDAGLRPLGCVAESIFPESGVVHSPWLRRLDGVLARILPQGLAYGLMVEAEAALPQSGV